MPDARAALMLLTLVVTCVPARADPGEAAATARGPAFEAGMVLARPAALETGLATGVGLGFVSGGGLLAWGARGSWASATEYTLTHEVRHDEVRLSLDGAVQHTLGPGTMALRLGLGGTLVRERRTRDQGGRAGLSGDALEATAWRALPGADLAAVVTLRVVGDWGLVVGGGPTLHLLEGDLRPGWAGTLAVAWLP